MNNRKYLKGATILGVVIALSFSQGCKKSFLDTASSNGSVKSTQFWKTQADATSAVNAMYADLHNWNDIAFAPIAIESMGSDDVTKGSVPTDATFMNEYHNFSVTAGEGQLDGFWSGMYANINFANQILDNVPNISMDAGLKARYLAEAKFIRAYDYFRLVRAFGNIVLRIHVPTSASQYNLPQVPAAQVWAQIESDLTDAAAVLPTTYSPADIGHVTKGAALALHAKVALYQKKWSDVVNYTNQVTTLGIYSLFPNYEKMFRTQNKNNSESIFEIQNMLIPNNPAASNSQYSQVQMPRVTEAAGGWGFNDPSPSLIAAFEPGDPRLKGTVIYTGQTTPEGDLIDASAPNPYYNMKSYVPFAEYVSGFNQGCQQDKIVLRYADVLLMNAEANNELGNASAALADLVVIRFRARAGNNAILPQITTTDQAALRTAIQHERRVELGMEFERHFDVIRWGLGTQVFGPQGFVAGKSELWPIPQNEIDLSGGLLKQNPGYN
ncbi:MAG: RagB/SusD family nutrient uptake outer membrane protein [Bacteroidetes bacterium]|nr:RagB/SusD family nutrient uptake outer membrane protein [Bacteroidota bacterium]